MAEIDISRNVRQFEAGDTFQFTLAATPVIPTSVAFTIFDFAGSTVSPVAVQSGMVVSESGNPAFNPSSRTGLFYVNRTVPTSVGFFFEQWTLWDTASREYISRNEFEVIETLGHSFQCYADIQDTMRSARQVFGAVTFRDMRIAIKEADHWIDTKLATIVGTVPVLPTPGFISNMSKCGAQFFYYSQRHAIDRDAAPPGIVDMWNRYNEMLDAVITGSLEIPGLEILGPSEEPLYVSTQDKAPIFGYRDFEDQRIDPDWIEHEAAKDD